MQREFSVNLGNLVLSLSDAMDLASPWLTQHQQRVAFVAWEMGKVAKLSHKRLEDIFIAALLHDIGAFSVEEKILLHNFQVENAEDHCICGELLLEKIPWLKGAAKTVRFHHKEWQDWDDSIEIQLVLDSQLLFLADSLERLIKRDQHILHQNEDIISKIKSFSGSSFHPQVVDFFSAASDREEFWLDLVSHRLYSLLLNNGPFRKTEIDLPNMFLISTLFRDIIDFRSHFTATHSTGVAAAASILSEKFGLTTMETQLMDLAGNLHDLGKLAIPNSILEKPGKLTKGEMDIMKSHAYYTYSVISSIGGIKHIAEWSAYHHEKLDGSGYPFHCKSYEISTGARILAVADIFTALAEDRPYRKRMLREEIIEIIKKSSDQRFLDTGIVNLLLENYDEIFSYVDRKQTFAREFYEKQFAFLGKG